MIDTTKVPFDVVPTHAAPTKEPDEEYTYTFAGWSPEPVAVTDEATYTATFTAVPRPYNVNVETAEHGTVTANPAEAAKGNQVTLTAEPAAGYALSSIKAFKKNTNSQQATLTALDGSSTGGEGYDKLVDGNTNTKWGFYGGSGYIIVKSDKAFILNDYSLTTANDTNNYWGRNWKNWEIYGANFASDSEAVKNSDQWQLVTSVTNDSKLQATNFTRYDYSVNTAPEAYQYYKIEISANKGDGYTQMSELTLSGANYDVEVVLMQDSADPAKYTFEMPASNVTVKAEFEEAPKYTVTWKNADGTTLETDNDVAFGATPTYNGKPPEKAEDENYAYTFAGWKVGETTYALNEALPPVTGDTTYTAQFTAKPKTLIAGHSLSLDGNIGINFYLDPSVAGLTVNEVTKDNLNYTFAWADVETTKAKVNVAEQANQKNFRVSEDGKYIIITCYVCAAEMTCGVNATFTLKGKTESKESKTYSVREYCNTVLHPTEEWLNAYKEKYPDGTAKCYRNLEGLVEAMLNYGAMAQTKFGINTGTPDSSDTPGTSGKLANEGVTYNPGDVTTAMLEKAIADANPNETAGNMNNVAAALGAKWFSTSLIYLDDSTLRHYFVKATDAFNPSAYTDNKSNYYYYVEKTGIPAAELDNLQTFTVGTESFKYSALDFVKGMITSSADEDSKNLAKSLYWYNKAANAYFPAPAPAQKIVDLSTLQGDYEAQDGDVLINALSGDYQITIAAGATVTLRDATITCLTTDAAFAGITPLGDATILLEGENTVKGGHRRMPGIYIPANKTLTIDGTGSLVAYSGGDFSDTYSSNSPASCGIGGKRNVSSGGAAVAGGNLVINGGTITAYGGKGCAGIGSCATNGPTSTNLFGDITINGGTVTASALDNAAGIGSGKDTSCGNITITGGTVTATGDGYAAGIGSGWHSNCGDITIAGTVTQVTATKGELALNSIGAGKSGSCGTVTIEDNSKVTQN